MSSASIQLAAVGIQDVYLYGKPEVSYFSGVFRRHSPFLLNSEEYPFNTPIQFGGSGFVKLPYKGDLLMGASLKVVLPPLFTPGPGWVYPLPTNIQSNINPYFNEYNYVDAPTQTLVRTNIPNFKVYFSDNSNTICYAQRSVKYYNTYSPISVAESVAFTGQLSSARLVLVTYSNTSAMTAGQYVVFPSYSTSVVNVTVPSCVNSNTVTATINSVTGQPLSVGMALTNLTSISNLVSISAINYNANNVPVTMNLSFHTQSFSGFTQYSNCFNQTRISNPYKLQTFDSGGTVFTYSTIDVTFSPSYLFYPIFQPVSIKIYDEDTLTEVSNATVLSATSVPWVRNDFISLSYDDPTNGWRWKSIYSLVKPFSNVYFNITSNTQPVPVGSNIIGLPFFTGNVTTTTVVTSNIVTPVNISTTEYISMNAPRMPVTIQLNDQILCQSNLISIQYPSQIDYSNLNMTFVDFKFSLGVTIGSAPNSVNILGITIAPAGNIITTIDKLPSSNVGDILYIGLNPVFYSEFSNIVAGAQKTLEFSNVQLLKNTTIVGLPYKATIKTSANSFTSNSVFTTFSSQQIIPVTSNVSVSFSTGGTGNVSYSFYSTPVTIKKIAFPTTQSAIFWGFDPAALSYTGARA